MPTIEDIVERFQRDLLRRDRRVALQIARDYAKSWARIKKNLRPLLEKKDGQAAGLVSIVANQKYLDLKKQVESEITKNTAAAGRMIRSEQKSAVRDAFEQTQDLILLELGPKPEGADIEIKKPDSHVIETILGVSLALSLLGRQLSEMSTKGSEAFEAALLDDLSLGKGPREGMASARNALGSLLTGMLELCRNEIMRASREASQKMYSDNGHAVRGWMWQAELDANCCPSCFAMYGTEHPPEEKFASHKNCRCHPVPITFDWDEIAARYGVDVSELKRDGSDLDALAKKYGISKADVKELKLKRASGENAFKALTDAQQRKILGPAKWLAWKEGKFDFSALSKETWSSKWGAGRGVPSLKELLGVEQADYYKKLNDVMPYSLKGVSLIDPERALEINQITDKAKFDSLVQDFKTVGWNGRPIIVVQTDESGFAAITGSHRLLAAREAGIKVPALVLKPKDSQLWFDLVNASDDDERVSILDQLHKKREINSDALRLMRFENMANLRNFNYKPVEESSQILKILTPKTVEAKTEEKTPEKQDAQNELTVFMAEMKSKYGNDIWSLMTNREIEEMERLERKAYK